MGVLGVSSESCFDANSCPLFCRRVLCGYYIREFSANIEHCSVSTKLQPPHGGCCLSLSVRAIEHTRLQQHVLGSLSRFTPSPIWMMCRPCSYALFFMCVRGHENNGVVWVRHQYKIATIVASQGTHAVVWPAHAVCVSDMPFYQPQHGLGKSENASFRFFRPFPLLLFAPPAAALLLPSLRSNTTSQHHGSHSICLGRGARRVGERLPGTCARILPRTDLARVW